MIIDQLTAIASPQGTDELPIERGQLTYKITWDDLAGADISALQTDMQNVQSDIAGLDSDITSLETDKADNSAFKGFTVTLASASWSNNAQTVSNALFLASGYSYIVSPAGASFSDYAAAQIYADDVTTDGQMIFHCENAPSADLTVNVARVVTS